jgi:hypothetical protein
VKKVLIVSAVLIVALVAALPALAMITKQYLPNSPNAGRSMGASLQTPSRAEYCHNNSGNKCDDDGTPNSKDRNDGIPNAKDK